MRRVDEADLERAWMAASAALPLEWRLEGLQCASAGLAPDQRSDRWRATATGLEGQSITGEDGTAVGALRALEELLLRRPRTSD